MSFAGDLSALYADFGESVTVAGSPITAIFDSGYVEALGVMSATPTLRCVASDVSGAAVGATIVRAGVNYTLREKQPIPPDELETRLILERA